MHEREIDQKRMHDRLCMALEEQGLHNTSAVGTPHTGRRVGGATDGTDLNSTGASWFAANAVEGMQKQLAE